MSPNGSLLYGQKAGRKKKSKAVKRIDHAERSKRCCWQILEAKPDTCREVTSVLGRVRKTDFAWKLKKGLPPTPKDK